ncbi:MAG: threonine synthase [Marinicaulis sp.]|nr:threonine synthase [Marinicaulis sp.]NNE41062.1 threonine synthase [Marinicaulis sp.]NNL89167.1 threonine synthase [Marinicaulis sp.]
MKYISTRGLAQPVDFEGALLAGLAPDGGLYVPAETPRLTDEDFAAIADAPYWRTAALVISKFTGAAFDRAKLEKMARDVYGRFDAPETAPLTKVGDEDWILELFHGPTLAFKDFAMQLLGAMFDDVLGRDDQRLTILAATSGDTGAAAIDALKACANVNIVVLHPRGRVSEVQRLMMTSVDAPNVMNIAVEGSFDDCQAIVKQLFADEAFARAVDLGGVNSINWARIAAQTVYYFTASAAVGGGPVNYVAPTGNFGDIYAGYVARCMGLNINRLVVAVNANDILHRALAEGDYSPRGVKPTISPSMDIEVASNFERLLFDVVDRDSERLRALMNDLAKTRALRLSDEQRARIAADFISATTSEDETRDEIIRHQRETGALIDPHTAVARSAARALRGAGHLTGKVITLSTAHPAKFPDAVTAACGVRPKLPTAHIDLMSSKEHMKTAPADTDVIKQMVGDFAARKP